MNNVKIMYYVKFFHGCYYSVRCEVLFYVFMIRHRCAGEVMPACNLIHERYLFLRKLRRFLLFVVFYVDLYWRCIMAYAS